MFNKRELIERLHEYIDKDNYDSAFNLFRELDGQYRKMLKKKQVNDDVLYELTDFIFDVISDFGVEFIAWVEEQWDPQDPVMLNDARDFIPEYNKLRYEKTLAKMDDFEKKEAELLYDAIWSRNQRAMVQCEIFDWDDDTDRSFTYSIPRLDREPYAVELKRLCSLMIYNRGSMIVRFYSKRGQYEIAGIRALNGTGEWSCMSEYEVQSCYDDGLKKNETAIILPHGDNEEVVKPQKILHMPKVTAQS